ncbi:MAG: hypothetical protein MJZ34_09725 [Paludibacteraceae bacterium]|nr:hypothetical protein [Paludibacteraceae bacterium]
MSLKDLFIKPEVNNKNTQSSTKEEEKTQKNITEGKEGKEPTSEQVIYSSKIGTEVSLDIQKKIWQTLVDRNIPGPDMMELITCSTSLESMGLSVDQRYVAAFKMLKSQYPNFDKTTLVNSVDTYISFVNEELASGKRQFKEKYKRDVEDKRAEIQSLNGNNSSILSQIEELKKKSESISEKIKQLEAEVEVSEKEITHNEQVFINTINAVIEKLTTDKNVMSNLNI